MQQSTSASSRWLQLDGRRQGFIRRCERYAGFTLPKICPPQGYSQDSDELQHDFQSLGAQAVNHLANKIMLALFAPSRPFFRLDADPKLAEQIAASGLDETKLAETLAQGEKAATRLLDSRGLRPALYEGIKHLIITGNFLECMSKDSIQVLGVKNFCVRRSATGKVVELIIAEKMQFDELERDVQEHVKTFTEYANRDTSKIEVTLYKWLNRDANGDMVMSQWVDKYTLPAKFSGKWPEAKCPYRVITWDLATGSHYGTGLVEDYNGDFTALSNLSQAQVQGAILASEFRWLLNPAGMTKADDLETSPNGAVLPGIEGDISIIESGKSRDLQVILTIAQDYITRIGRGFLLGSAVTRDAERVTAEEIRMQANELETAYGGVYSRLAIDLQDPLAHWLLVGIGMDHSSIQPVIVTGMEALSRQGDLEDLRLFLSDIASLGAMPPEVLQYLKRDSIFSALATGRRLIANNYVKSEEEVQAAIAQAQQAAQVQQAQQVGLQAGADIAVSKETKPTQ